MVTDEKLKNLKSLSILSNNIEEDYGPKIPMPPKLPSPKKSSNFFKNMPRKKIRVWGIFCILFGIIGVILSILIYFLSLDQFSASVFLRDIFSYNLNNKLTIFGAKETIIVLTTPFIYFSSFILGGIGFLFRREWGKYLIRGLFGILILAILIGVFFI